MTVTFRLAEVERFQSHPSRFHPLQLNHLSSISFTMTAAWKAAGLTYAVIYSPYFGTR